MTLSGGVSNGARTAPSGKPRGRRHKEGKAGEEGPFCFLQAASLLPAGSAVQTLMSTQITWGSCRHAGSGSGGLAGA